MYALGKELAVTMGQGSNGGNGVGELVYVIQIGDKVLSVTTNRL